MMVHSSASGKVEEEDEQVREPEDEGIEVRQCSGCGAHYRGPPNMTFCDECGKKLEKAARVNGSGSGEPKR